MHMEIAALNTSFPMSLPHIRVRVTAALGLDPADYIGAYRYSARHEFRTIVDRDLSFICHTGIRTSNCQ